LIRSFPPYFICSYEILSWPQTLLFLRRVHISLTSDSLITISSSRIRSFTSVRIVETRSDISSWRPWSLYVVAKQIEEDIDYDQKSVWSIINKRKKKPSICNALKKGDSVFTDPNDVSNIWYDHFRNVFSPSTYSDQGRQDEISERVSTIRTIIDHTDFWS
jgi:hypothetical protein